ncbi:phosphate propanoyltransferase [Streptococcus pseudopneumoniae]|uniref:phosphate propanoyltransferase n=1 Tax=Streptococcus pseudopneumoniae TaxID=257758 RepID=UPI00025B743D|nr:phosphate propanoyltransferase [Streptococcus pseudopneumoniae]EID70365.1 propanediol utilization protein PduL [Streptococcus pseudopneumoniae SK674]OOR79090.1 propanediol utilization protein [Streptococcus pseudopneumoniae]
MEINQVIINISARHVHLKGEHLDILFGEGYQLNKLKDLYQPGEFAAEEQVTIQSASGEINRVRVLGPIRPYTQVEVSKTDSRLLKITPPVRTSSEIENSSPITIIGPNGRVNLDEGCIIANRHIHFATEEAEEMGLKNGDIVSVEVKSEKSATLHDVHCRVSDKYRLEMHIDTDDANALLLSGGEIGTIIKE